MNFFNRKFSIVLIGAVVGSSAACAVTRQPVTAENGMVVTSQHLASEGSPGGSRIITIVVETIMNVVDHGMQVQEAVNAPRFHHQWLPDQITVEPFALSPDTAKLLKDMGHKVVEQAPWGAVEAILIGPAED